MANKLTQVHIYIIGFVLMVIVGVGLFFTILKPLQVQKLELDGQIATTQNSITEVNNAQKTMEQAQAKLQTSKRQFATLTALKKLPPNRTIDLGETASQEELLSKTMDRWLTLPKFVIQRLERFSRQAAAKHKVTAVTNFAAPATPVDPNAIPRDIIAWPIGNLRVEGDFNNVMAWVKEWNRSADLVSIEGLKCSIAGKDGRVVATAGMSVYIFPTGKAAEAAAATASTGAGGGGGGGGGGSYPMGGSAGGSAGSYPSGGNSAGGSASGAGSPGNGVGNGP